MSKYIYSKLYIIFYLLVIDILQIDLLMRKD